MIGILNQTILHKGLKNVTQIFYVLKILRKKFKPEREKLFCVEECVVLSLHYIITNLCSTDNNLQKLMTIIKYKLNI